MKKIILLMLMIFLILITCAGCREQEKKLTICIDSFYKDSVKDIIEMWQNLNKGIKVELIVIPEKTDEAQIKITEIRTAIMSGEGPDIFILHTYHPNVIDAPPILFDNVEKAMYSEVFLPLDRYIDQAQYMHADAFNPVILDSGRTDEGQLVLPIYYGYFAGAILNDNDIDLPYSWDELVNNKDSDVEIDIPSFSLRFFDVFGSYADYKSCTFLYSEDELLNRVQEAILYDNNRFQHERNDDSVTAGLVSDILYQLDDQADVQYKLYGIPSVEGGFTANILMYAAINRNTRLPSEAFSILDILFSDEVMMDVGFIVDDKIYGKSIFSPIYLDGILAHEEGFNNAIKLFGKNVPSFNDINNNITNVRYYSNLDKDFLDIYTKCSSTENEEEQRQIVNQIYNRMQMKLAE